MELLNYRNTNFIVMHICNSHKPALVSKFQKSLNFSTRQDSRLEHIEIQYKNISYKNILLYICILKLRIKI